MKDLHRVRREEDQDVLFEGSGSNIDGANDEDDDDYGESDSEEGGASPLDPTLLTPSQSSPTFDVISGSAVCCS